jgi:hypothetical protein
MPIVSNMNDELNKLQLPISQEILHSDEETKNKVFKYLSQLTEVEKKTYIIAYSHLGTSFDILRSNGYNNWLSKPSNVCI